MSAYENGKNNPTIDVLMNIADKCSVSLDWLAEEVTILSVFQAWGLCFIYVWTGNEKRNKSFKIIVEDKFPNDIETDENKWNAKLISMVMMKSILSQPVCNILKELSDNLFDLESYSITKEQFDSMKNKSLEYCSTTNTERIWRPFKRWDSKRGLVLKENSLL